MAIIYSDIPDDDIYDAVCTDDDHEIYEDLCALRRQSEGQVQDDNQTLCMSMACWDSVTWPPMWLFLLVHTNVYSFIDSGMKTGVSVHICVCLV